MREMAHDAAPLFGYCYDVAQTSEGEAEGDPEQTEEKPVTSWRDAVGRF